MSQLSPFEGRCVSFIPILTTHPHDDIQTSTVAEDTTRIMIIVAVANEAISITIKKRKMTQECPQPLITFGVIYQTYSP